MERERITISIKKSLLDKIDEVIDGVNIRNRSHAIETLASKSLDLDSSNNAVILMGGEDALKTIPVVEDNLKQLAEAGFEKVYIALGYLGSKIKSKIGDGKRFGLEIEYLDEGDGSGGAIALLKDIFIKTFLVFNQAEKISEINLRKLFEYHKKVKTEATIITDNIDEMNGLYILEPEIFDYIPEGFSMIESDIFPKLIEENKLTVYPII